MENKWRAARYGLDGKMIDFGKQTEVPVRDLMNEILDFVCEVVAELDSAGRDRLHPRILEERQRRRSAIASVSPRPVT